MSHEHVHLDPSLFYVPAFFGCQLMLTQRATLPFIIKITSSEWPTRRTCESKHATLSLSYSIFSAVTSCNSPSPSRLSLPKKLWFSHHPSTKPKEPACTQLLSQDAVRIADSLNANDSGPHGICTRLFEEVVSFHQPAVNANEVDKQTCWFVEINNKRRLKERIQTCVRRANAHRDAKLK